MPFDPAPLLDTLVRFALDLIGAILLLIAAWFLSRWARRATAKSLGKTRLDQTLIRFFSNLAGWTVLGLGVIATLSIVGISTASFAAVIGAMGLAIGLAFQGTLSNFSAGVMLLIFRPFKAGDAVRAAGQLGKVYEIDLLTTQLDTPDNRRIIIPNSKIFGDIIETITYHPIRRVDVAVGTDYGDDLDQVRAVLEAAVSSVEGGLEEPAPQVFLDVLGDSSIAWYVRLWCNTPDYWAVRERLTRAVKKALDDAGLSIPFPQLDVHLDGALEKQG